MVQALKQLALLAAGFVFFWALLRWDMKAGGNVAAKYVHHEIPECSGPCHG